jgi:endonuclease YncB( thermonuclease family)
VQVRILLGAPSPFVRFYCVIKMARAGMSAGSTSAAPATRSMAHWAYRRYPERSRIRRSDFRTPFVIVILACAAGYSAYKQWTTKYPYRDWTTHWTRHWATPRAAMTGKPWVIDGDTIDISGTRVRLEGIDAPESNQTCGDARGQPWPCGRTATHELQAYLGSRELTCRPSGFDRYRRVLATCSLSGGGDVNAWMVRQGWALAYDYARTYQSEQDAAAAARRGIWAGTFIPPSEWRKRHRD